MNKLQILVVDDESRMRKLVRDFLQREGYNVLEAGDGMEAMEIFYEDKDIALLILDVMMPKMDGWQVCREVRQTSNVPIIMLTARSEERDELQGFELGVDEYISKQGGNSMSFNLPISKEQRHAITSLGTAVLGAVMFAFGLNVMIIPLSLYNGGFMGIAQLIRTLLIAITGISFGQTDIAGTIYFLLNLPLIYLAWSKMGKGFFVRSMIVIVVQTAALTLIPIPSTPLIEDYLTACIVGGIIAGAGSGLILRGESSGGGQDILGIYMTQRFPGFSVGKVGLLINIFVYSICFFMFNIEIVIYSLIYGVVYATACDHIHIQNINVSVMIFTKKAGIAEAIMEQTRRGVTNWDGEGAYTHADSSILMVVVSKYEVNELKRIVKSIDPNAFMIFTEGCDIDGNFEKRLT